VKKAFILVIFLFVFNVLKAEQHIIVRIFEDGKAIELNDGSIWAIGYWGWNDFFDQPTVYNNWQVGDSLEFFSLWKGTAYKAAFHITNLRLGHDVRGWLYQPPRQDSMLVVKDVDPSTGIITLTDGSKWQNIEKQDRYFHLYEVTWEKKVYLLKSTLGSFYLCRANSEEPKGIEVFQVRD
jgi:hypothetical protein